MAKISYYNLIAIPSNPHFTLRWPFADNSQPPWACQCFFLSAFIFPARQPLNLNIFRLDQGNTKLRILLAENFYFQSFLCCCFLRLLRKDHQLFIHHAQYDPQVFENFVYHNFKQSYILVKNKEQNEIIARWISLQK